MTQTSYCFKKFTLPYNSSFSFFLLLLWLSQRLLKTSRSHNSIQSVPPEPSMVSTQRTGDERRRNMEQWRRQSHLNILFRLPSSHPSTCDVSHDCHCRLINSGPNRSSQDQHSHIPHSVDSPLSGSRSVPDYIGDLDNVITSLHRPSESDSTADSPVGTHRGSIHESRGVVHPCRVMLDAPLHNDSLALRISMTTSLRLAAERKNGQVRLTRVITQCQYKSAAFRVLLLNLHVKWCPAHYGTVNGECYEVECDVINWSALQWWTCSLIHSWPRDVSAL